MLARKWSCAPCMSDTVLPLPLGTSGAHMPIRPLRALALVLVSLVSCRHARVGASPASASAAGRRRLRGRAPRCRVVARVDVDGNGTRDPVALDALAARTAGPHGSLVVRVKVGPHRIVKVRRKLPYWYGACLAGLRLHRRTQGARARGGPHGWCARRSSFACSPGARGRLVDLRAPGGGVDWYIDGAYSISIGYLHRAGTPAGSLLHRVADRWIDDRRRVRGDRRPLRLGRWSLEAHPSQAYPYLDEQTAYRWGGWRIPGSAASDRPDR